MTETALEQLSNERELALSRQFEHCRPQLKRMIALRTCDRLRRRVDDSDVVQETYLEAARRLDQYLARPLVPPTIWLRRIGRQVLARHYRRHFGTAMRSLDRENSFDSAFGPGADPRALSDYLARSDSPLSSMEREEQRTEVRKLLAELTPLDREVLCLKQVEGLTFEEVAIELGVSVSTAKRRLLQAMERFRSLTIAS